MYNSKSLFIFPTQVIVSKSETFLTYKRKLIDTCYKFKDKYPDKKNRSNRFGWQSKKGDHHKDPEFYSLFEDFNNMFSYCLKNEFKSKKGVKYAVDGSFLQISPPNAFNFSHIHPKPYLTCVFYIKIPKNSGNISFACPDTYLLNHLTGNRDQDFIIQNNLQTKFEIVPEEGMLLIFPSTLNHQVEPNLSNEDRISMGIDINLISYGSECYEYE